MPAPGAKHGWKTNKDKRKKKDCKEAQKEIEKDNEEGVEQGNAHVELRWDEGEVKTTKGDDGRYTSSGKISYRFDERKSHVTTREYSWNNMSEADKKAAGQYNQGMKDHEQGHMQVAEQYVKDYPSEQVTGEPADTPERARENYEKAREESWKEYQEGHKERQEKYNEATDRGAAQSKGPETKDEKGNKFPGGKDAKLDCPPAAGGGGG
jgi:hypothetical protein